MPDKNCEERESKAGLRDDCLVKKNPPLFSKYFDNFFEN